MLGLISGAVTPLGLLNDREHTVPFWLGKSFLKCSRLIGVHLNTNTATVWLKAQDLSWLLNENDTQIPLFETRRSSRIFRPLGDPFQTKFPYTVLVNKTTQHRGIFYKTQFDVTGVQSRPQ